ncbi:MAG: hypothetical protein QM520_05130 [Gammaproteobacteria bacterium]|nr:hypothetical protein [Gammaproteobacteria bacterium]
MFEDIVWFLLLIPGAFVLGWLASRLDVVHWRIENRRNPKAYFKAMNFLVNQQIEDALQNLIEAIRINPENKELPHILAGLLQRSGDWDKTLSLYNQLLHRSDLNDQERLKVIFSMAECYYFAGMYSQSSQYYQNLLNTSYRQLALKGLLRVSERTKNWSQALSLSTQLADHKTSKHHYWCEEGKLVAISEGAKEIFQKVIEDTPKHPRAYMELARWYADNRDYHSAFDTLWVIFENMQYYAPLVCCEILGYAQHIGQESKVFQAVEKLFQKNRCVDFARTLEENGHSKPSSGEYFMQMMRQSESLLAALLWVQPFNFLHDEQKLVHKILQHKSQDLDSYRCSHCGLVTKKFYWQCVGCKSWDTIPPLRLGEL